MPKLEKNQYFTVLRLARNSSISVVQSLRTATFRNLRRLGLKRDASKAVKKTPRGSDQVDVGSVVTWMEKITEQDHEAIEQLKTIDATLVARS